MFRSLSVSPRTSFRAVCTRDELARRVKLANRIFFMLGLRLAEFAGSHCLDCEPLQRSETQQQARGGLQLAAILQMASAEFVHV